MEPGDHVGEVVGRALDAWILKDRAEHRGGVEIGEGIADDDPPAERLGPGLQHRDGLRQALRVDEEGVGFGGGDPARHAHRLGGGGRLVEQRGVGDVEPGQVADAGLEVEQGLEPALADLGLVGRIGRVPGRVLEDVALDRRRHRGAVIALADQRGQELVLVGGGAQPLDRTALRQGGTELGRFLLADAGRQGLVDQCVEAVGTDHLQHAGDLLHRRADMAAVGEVVGIVLVHRHGRCASVLSRVGRLERWSTSPLSRVGEGSGVRVLRLLFNSKRRAGSGRPKFYLEA